MAVITPKDAKERTGIISAEAAIRFNVDAMNRDPNVVTRGLGERVVKPATEILWAGFFYIGAEQNSERATMNLFKRLCREEEGQGFDGVHVGDRSRRAGILDGGSGHASRTESSSGLDEGTRLRYLTVFLHRLSGRSRGYLTRNEAMTHSRNEFI
jgi:hypothetical protein